MVVNNRHVYHGSTYRNHHNKISNRENVTNKGKEVCVKYYNTTYVIEHNYSYNQSYAYGPQLLYKIYHDNMSSNTSQR